MGYLQMLILGLVLLVIVIFDTKFYRIPNECIWTGILAGFIFHPIGIATAIIQMCIVFMIFYPFFLCKGIGAGDIKLIMMLACFFEKHTLFLIILVSFAAGAMISIIKIVFDKQAREQLYKGLGFMKKAIITRTIDPYECNRSNKNTMIRMSIPIIIGTIFGGFII